MIKVHTPFSPVVSVSRTQRIRNPDRYSGGSVTAYNRSISAVAVKSYFLTPAREPKLTKPVVVHKAIRGLKVVKPPGSNGFSNKV
jgi:hypothetical protein